uniref:Xylanase inhibitor C-terminal domain-containing protein n=1 Tax=Aegilops tauschii TaxID=37682 RepID=M8AU33_AEGTA
MSLVALLVLAASLAWPASSQGLPVLVPVTKDPATSLYTLPFHSGANLVVDITGPLVWSTCQPGHLPAKFPCTFPTCRLANAYPVPGCHEPGCEQERRKDGTCTAYTYNPVTGVCASGSLDHTRFVANTTDGSNPVRQTGYWVPDISLALEGGMNYSMNGLLSMVNVPGGAACLAFAEMKGVKAGDGSAPAVIIGGFQMENVLLEFDMEKKRLGVFRLPFFTRCGHFNFTRTG